MLKHALYSCAAALLVCAALLAPRHAFAADATPVGSLNGYAWMDSDNSNKLSFLLGVETAIAMEMALSQEQQKITGKPGPLSPFQQGWMAAFDNTPRQTIADRIDAFYVANPSQKNRHVFDVLWEQMIVPAFPARR